MHLKKLIPPTSLALIIVIVIVMWGGKCARQQRPYGTGFDKEMLLTTALKTPLNTHLSVLSSPSLPLLPISQTPTPTLTSTSIITTLEPYTIPPKS